MKKIFEVKSLRISIGCDHGAVELKDAVKKVLDEFENVEVHDVGTFGSDAVDYPDIAEKVCAEIASGNSERGILMCGTGIGISIAANKFHGIRCALCHDVFSAKMSREHNNANVLAMGGRVIGFGPAAEIVRAWITTDFSNDERHLRRISKIRGEA